MQRSSPACCPSGRRCAISLCRAKRRVSVSTGHRCGTKPNRRPPPLSMRPGRRWNELAIAPEHHRLAEAQNTIMLFEMVRALAYERIEHSAELSPRLGQMLDAGMAVGAEEYDRALASAAEARVGLDAFFGAC